MTTERIAQKFWSRVAITENPEDCWEWQAGGLTTGYGIMRYEQKERVATHIAWHLTHGTFPAQELLHICDNPPCVNPNHLRPGSHRDNMADMVTKQRHAFGERAGQSKLKNVDVARIVEMVLSGISQREVARQFGVSHTTVNDICRGKTWRLISPDVLPGRKLVNPQWRCQHCRQVFTDHAVKANGGVRKFCSRHCRWEYVREPGHGLICPTFELVKPASEV